MRPLPTAHEFVVATLEASPEFHQGKLRAIGLHDAVLAFLLSPSAKARTYAMRTRVRSRFDPADAVPGFRLLAQADACSPHTARVRRGGDHRAPGAPDSASRCSGASSPSRRRRRGRDTPSTRYEIRLL